MYLVKQVVLSVSSLMIIPEGGAKVVATQELEMSELLEIACGPRTINEFANSCGISRAHIFRIKKNAAKPSRKICRRMAEDWYVKQIGLTCEQIYKTAGYVDAEDIREAKRFEEQRDEATIDLGIITRNLMESKVTYQLLPRGEEDVNFAFQVSIGRKKTTWNFIILKECLQDASSKISVNAYYFNLGRMIALLPSSKVQYTLIVHTEDAYDRLVTKDNNALVKANITVVWIDIDKMLIQREAVMGPDGVRYTLTD